MDIWPVPHTISAGMPEAILNYVYSFLPGTGINDDNSIITGTIPPIE